MTGQIKVNAYYYSYGLPETANCMNFVPSNMRKKSFTFYVTFNVSLPCNSFSFLVYEIVASYFSVFFGTGGIDI